MAGADCVDDPGGCCADERRDQEERDPDEAEMPLPGELAVKVSTATWSLIAFTNARDHGGRSASAGTTADQGKPLKEQEPRLPCLSARRSGRERERTRVDDYEVCVGFLNTVEEQPLDSPDGRVVARTLLGKIKEKCGGVPGLVSLIAATLSAVSALA